jgi:hypothetical protein
MGHSFACGGWKRDKDRSNPFEMATRKANNGNDIDSRVADSSTSIHRKPRDGWGTRLLVAGGGQTKTEADSFGDANSNGKTTETETVPKLAESTSPSV